MENIKNVVEALIFSSGSPIAKRDLIEKLPELTGSQLNAIIKDLQKKYSGDCGILLLEFNGKYQFSSNPCYGDVIAEILTPLRERELSKTLLEVLSTIAYKQPITRMEIDDMRGGTSCEYAITGLLKAGLICTARRTSSSKSSSFPPSTNSPTSKRLWRSCRRFTLPRRKRFSTPVRCTTRTATSSRRARRNRLPPRTSTRTKSPTSCKERSTKS